MKTCSNDGPKVRRIRRAAMVLCVVTSGFAGGPSALADLPQNEDAQAFIELVTSFGGDAAFANGKGTI